MSKSFAVLSFVLLCLGATTFGFNPNFIKRSPSDGGSMVDGCSEGWRITGYYTPVETDFDSDVTREIEIRGLGLETFNADFLRTIFDEDKGYGEGWGKTRFGWYLGNYGGRWHRADAPLDANDRPLQPDAVAVDNAIIPVGSTVSIPDLPGDLGKLTFHSTDVGVSVHGKHIDVYTGEGREARRKMYRFTYEEGDKGLQRVCFEPKVTPDVAGRK